MARRRAPRRPKKGRTATGRIKAGFYLNCHGVMRKKRRR